MKTTTRSIWILSLGAITTAALLTAQQQVHAEMINLAPAAPVSSTNYRATFTGRGYYVDSIRGNDGSDGTEANPWKTLARASQATLAAGDALLLRCGRQFRETVEFTSKFAPSGSILIGGYGDCTGTNRPEIIGSERIPDIAWQVVSTDTNGTIYKAQITGDVAGVLRSNEPQIRARHRNYTSPNTEFSISKSGTNSSQIVLSDADRQAIGSSEIVGATIVIRSAPYYLEKNTIQSYNSTLGIATLSSATIKTPIAGSGYYLEGKRWMLDADREWLADAYGNLYTYISKTQQAIGFPNFEIVRQKSTVKITGIRNVRVERLRINNSGLNGIHVVNSGESQIEDLSVSYSYCNGILLESTNGLPSSEGGSIKSSMLYANKVSGITSSVKRTSISLNKITSTGTLPGQTSNGAAIRLSAPSATVERNDIYLAGQYGITFDNRGGSAKISNNFLNKVCLRLSDCGGIYSWGKNETGLPGLIASNQISSTNYANTNGAAGGAPDLVSGIYLDELSNNLDVASNSISDVRIGIYLHKSSNNRISNNIVDSASQSGIRLSSDWLDGTTTQGNRIEFNTLYVPNFFAVGSDGLPQKAGGVPQEWIHVTDVGVLLTGTNRNTSNNNVSIHLGDAAALRWRAQSGQVVSNIESVGWKTYFPTDLEMSPFRGRMAAVAGRQIIKNPTLESSGFYWDSYSYQPSAKIVAFNQASLCSGSCAVFTPATNLDVLYQQNLTIQNPNSSLMFFRYRALAGSTDSSSKLEVRGNTAPYPPAGYLEDLIALPRNSERRQESFFKRTVGGDLRLSIKATAGSNLMIDDVELFEVTGYNLLSPSSISRLVVNATEMDMPVSCSELKSISCTFVDASGNNIALPLIVPKNSRKLIFVKDSNSSY